MTRWRARAGIDQFLRVAQGSPLVDSSGPRHVLTCAVMQPCAHVCRHAAMLQRGQTATQPPPMQPPMQPRSHAAVRPCSHAGT
eukprot:365239-Chlamydomonas_euryale.AAC.3